jgi:hypothetical protein
VEDGTAKTQDAKQEQEVFAPDIVVSRAYSRLGESGYSLFRNNCEHFASWCKVGKESSQQVSKFVQIGLKDVAVPIAKSLAISKAQALFLATQRFVKPSHIATLKKLAKYSSTLSDVASVAGKMTSSVKLLQAGGSLIASGLLSSVLDEKDSMPAQEIKDRRTAKTIGTVAGTLATFSASVGAVGGGAIVVGAGVFSYAATKSYRAYLKRRKLKNNALDLSPWLKNPLRRVMSNRGPRPKEEDGKQKKKPALKTAQVVGATASESKN